MSANMLNVTATAAECKKDEKRYSDAEMKRLLHTIFSSVPSKKKKSKRKKRSVR